VHGFVVDAMVWSKLHWIKSLPHGWPGSLSPRWTHLARSATFLASATFSGEKAAVFAKELAVGVTPSGNGPAHTLYRGLLTASQQK